MRIAWLRRPGDGGFAVARDRGWVPLSDAGMDVADTPELMTRLGEVAEVVASARGEALDESAVELGCPLVRPEKILGIGPNYLDHLRETGDAMPERPGMFAKLPNALTGPRDPILLDPATTDEADYEVELAAVIGRSVRRADPARALEAVGAWCVADDVCARDWQRVDGQFTRSKGFDSFCPAGPWLTTVEEVADVQALALRCWVNGELRQSSTTAEMMFTVAELVASLSEAVTLRPGDVILTGTPQGAGFAMDPPRALAPGDVVRCEVEGLGALENEVVADPA